MSIEIKELIIKTTVTNHSSNDKKNESLNKADVSQLKSSILKECQALIDEKLKDSNRR